MSLIIQEKLLYLIDENKDRWEDAEKLRIQFTKDYSKRRISNLTLDEYVIGKGAQNRSFCYLIERKMDSLGRILEARADKFGIWYGKIGSNKSIKYRFAKKFGSNINYASRNIKDNIVKLLDAAEKNNFEDLRKNPISPMFKGKLLFIYYPDRFLPVYSERHLRHFIHELNLFSESSNELDMQKTIMDYKASFPELMKTSVFAWPKLLYDHFGYPPDTSVSGVSKIPILKEVSAEFINILPVSSMEPDSNTESRSGDETDYGAISRSRKRIGSRGEKIVLMKEIERLKNAGKNNLINDVKIENNDREGYDIHSFDEDGTERFIEVKSSTSFTIDRGFYITANELEKSQSITNYYLYLVFSVDSRVPKIYIIKNPDFKDNNIFILSPIQYHVKLFNT